MQVSPIFDAVWKTMRRCLNRPVGFAFAAALIVVITYQLASKLANFNQPQAHSARPSAPASESVFAGNTNPASAGNQPEQRARMQEAFGKMPLAFIENRGQLDARVGYYVQGHDKTVYFTPQGLTFALTQTEPQPVAAAAPELPTLLPAAFRPSAFGLEGSRPSLGQREEPRASQPQRWVVKLDFVGANPQVRLTGRDATGAVISYFKGSQAQWRTGLKSYTTLVYEELWPGIDLVYSGTVNRMKHHFLIKLIKAGGSSV